MKYKRIMIIGGGGAGKTTLANELAKLFNIDVYHLDKLYWLPNWQRPDKETWFKKMEELLKLDSWIIDGTYESTLTKRLEKADLVIYLKINKYVRIRNILKRIKKSKHTSRDDLALGCTEKLNLSFLKWAFQYDKKYAPLIEADLKKFPKENIIVCKNKKDVNNLLNTLKGEQNE